VNKQFLSSPGKTVDLSWATKEVFHGVSGTCPPFVERLSFALRSLELEQVFVPFIEEDKAKKISHVKDVGMQARVAPIVLKPRAIVVVGGSRCPTYR
jgi:hypothetical protein